MEVAYNGSNEVSKQIPLVRECLENETYSTISNIVTLITLLSTFFGNSLIIVSILRFKEFQKGVTHKLILQVAIADLVLLAALITYPIELAKPGIFRVPKVCITRSIFSFISVSASISFLTFISLDRFYAVMCPIRHMLVREKTWQFYVVIVIVWLVSCATGVIVLLKNVFEVTGYDGQIDGCPVAWYSVEALLNVSSAFLVITFVTNFVSYGCVLNRLIRRNVYFNRASKQKQLSKTKLLLIVYTVFTVSWCPFLFCQIWLLASNNSSKVKCYREYCLLFGILNSGVNWILYGVGNKKYRAAFKRLLCCCKTDNIIVISNT